MLFILTSNDCDDEIDLSKAIDIDSDRDWRAAEQTLREIGLPFVRPGRVPRKFPKRIEMLVLDFDGTLTDDRVWVNSEGDEWVAAHRGDGAGLARLRERGVQIHILTAEIHPVVAARARKLNVPVTQGVQDKAGALERMLSEMGILGRDVVYVGNDVNDLPCFPIVGFAAAVGDAHISVKREADLVLSRPGGLGAVRELCDMMLSRMEQQ